MTAEKIYRIDLDKTIHGVGSSFYIQGLSMLDAITRADNWIYELYVNTGVTQPNILNVEHVGKIAILSVSASATDIDVEKDTFSGDEIPF